MSTTDQNPAPRPLDGVRVLDFSHALAGPYCTLLLADYGAEVYKLEPRSGDMGRGWGPPFQGGEASFFLGLNRGKRGVSFDLKTPEGMALCLRLIDRMDVLIENFRPGTMERLGLGYAALHARNPQLIYCSISGYGQQGPARDEAAMDLVMQSSSGLLSITGTAAGEMVRCGYGVTDVTAGLFAVIGILLALQARPRTGGQYVDVGMLDGMVSTMSSNYMTYLGSQQIPRPMGTAFTTIVPYRVFAARDRAVSIAVGSEKLWRSFCDALDQPDWKEHPDYATNAQRIMNRATLEPAIEHVMSQQPADYWIARLHTAGIPAAVVSNFQDVVASPQAAIRQLFPTLDHPTAGPHQVTGTPVKLSATPGRPGRPAPLLGQHSTQVLRDLLGLEATEIATLSERGIIFDAKMD